MGHACVQESMPIFFPTWKLQLKNWGICRDKGKPQKSSSNISPTTKALQENIHARALYSD